MFCPFCGLPAHREVTGNGGWLYVGEDIDGNDETFDAEISMWRCSSNNPAHVFYADDGKGNKQ